jgi:dolichol-phosphate mannosyltransferase
MQPELCLVVPCYNEEEMLPAFLARVKPAIDAATGGSWKILFVDDGSSDRTFDIILGEHLEDPRVTGIRLSRNFGHQAAVSAGLAYASGAFLGVMDCDLQDPIEILVELFRKARSEDLDVCYGIRGRRDAPRLLRLGYYLFYRIIQRVAEHEWPKDAGDFCIMSVRCHQVLLALPESSRVMRGLRAWVGLKQSGISYDRPARLHGRTKYSFGKLWALAMQGLVAFSSVPLRLASIVGLSMGAFSTVFGVGVLINRLFPQLMPFPYWVGKNAGVATILVFVSLVSSILFLCLGIIGEYLVLMLEELKRRPTAVVAAALGTGGPHQSAYTVVHCTEVPPAVEHYAETAGRSERAGAGKFTKR